MYMYVHMTVAVIAACCARFSDLHRLTMTTEPKVYASGLHKMHLNMRKMLEWIVHALILSAVVFWITFGSIIGNFQWDKQYVVTSPQGFCSRPVPVIELATTRGARPRVFVCWFPNSGLTDGKDVAGMAVYTILIFAMQLKVRSRFAFGFGCAQPLGLSLLP
jgi:hypothetical protein